MLTEAAYKDSFLELTEGWDVLGPLDEHQQLLFHGLTHIRDAGDLFRPNVAIDSGDRGGDLGEAKENAGVAGAPLHILCPLHKAPTPPRELPCLGKRSWTVGAFSALKEAVGKLEREDAKEAVMGEEFSGFLTTD